MMKKNFFCAVKVVKIFFGSTRETTSKAFYLKSTSCHSILFRETTNSAINFGKKAMGSCSFAHETYKLPNHHTYNGPLTHIATPVSIEFTSDLLCNALFLPSIMRL